MEVNIEAGVPEVTLSERTEYTIPFEVMQKIHDNLRTGRKIEAIKALRVHFANKIADLLAAEGFNTVEREKYIRNERDFRRIPFVDFLIRVSGLRECKDIIESL